MLIGKDNPSYISDAMADYQKRLTHYSRFETLTISPGKSPDPKTCKAQEAAEVFGKLSSRDRLILLDEKGKQYNSRAFSEWLEHQMTYDSRDIVFLIGGAWGFDEKLYDRAEGMIRLSDLTFSHQIARVVFLEQLYRAFTIIRNEPYHND